MRNYVVELGVLISLAIVTPAIAGSIADGAIFPITQNQYPKTYQKWGKDGVARINALLRPAAEIIAASPSCDKVELVELSDSKSVPTSKIVFFADCSNGQRFYISEAEIKEKRGVQSQNDKAASISDTTLLEACRKEIRRRLKFPSTFNPGWFGNSVYRAPAGRTVATIEFKAKNSLGAELPHVGKCYANGNELTDVEISPR